MNDFDNNWRRKQELKGRPIADGIYKMIFGEDIIIERFERPDNKILDKEFAIDVKVKFTESGLILLGQEKFLSNKYIGYESITVEEYQDQSTKEEGDWFKIGVQFYFVSYFNEDYTDFGLWIMIDWTKAVILTAQNKINWYSNKNQDGSARASFRYTYMKQIPSEAIIANSWEVITCLKILSG